jgi:hypothetical protein
MKRLFLAAGLAAALITTAAPLASCSTTGQASAHLTAARSLYIAEIAYHGFATSIVQAHDSGLLTGDKLAQAKAVEARAYQALLLARQGRASVDQVTDALKAGEGLVPTP